MEEIWKDITGYEGKYQVSDGGNVRSVQRNLILKQQTNLKNAHPQVVLWKNSKATIVYVHRLVAQTFLVNENNYKYVGHRDGDKLNNKLDNLYYTNKKPQVAYKKQQKED